MTSRRNLFTFAALGTAAVIAPIRVTHAADGCPSPPASAHAAILDRYVAAINALDVAAFPDIFTESYIQHSGRRPSGLSAQIANAQRLHATWPDIHMQVEGSHHRCRQGCRAMPVRRNTCADGRGFAPTGKRISFATIDISRVEGGKFAEHWDLVDFAGMEKQLAGK